MIAHEPQRKLVLFDIDRTAYRDYLIFPLVDSQFQDGLIEQGAYQGIEESRAKHERGELSYESMVQEVVLFYAQGLSGQTLADVTDHTRSFLSSSDGDNFYAYVGEVTDLVRPTHDVYFITGEPQFVADVVTQRYDAHGYISTVFDTANAHFTGQINSALSSSSHKRDAIRGILATHDRRGSFAFGDSEGDRGMLESVTFPVMVNPTPELDSIAPQHWERRRDEISIEAIPIFVARNLSNS